MKPKILITGATGKTGLPLVERLAKLRAPFRALVHSSRNEQLVKKLASEVMVGDYGDTASLERALEGIEKVYLLSPPSAEQFKTQAAIVDIAKRKGVEHLVKLSALGAALDSPVGLLRVHAEIEDYIKKSGIGWTFLRPHFFMENLLMHGPTILKEGTIYSPLGDARLSTISVKDIAAVAAAVLQSKNRAHIGKIYELTGPRAVTYAEIAGVLGEVLGREIRYVPVPFETARLNMVKSDMPQWLADDMIRLMKTWVDGKGGFVTSDVEKVIGRKPISIKAFFKEKKEIFSGTAVKAA